MEDKYQLGAITAEVKNLKQEVSFMREDIAKLHDLLGAERINIARMSSKIAILTGIIGTITGSLSAWLINYLLTKQP